VNYNDIKLPPLPPLHIAPSVEPVDYPEVAQALIGYARAAIKADRQRRNKAMQAECEELRKDAELSGRVLDFALEYWRERYQRPFDYADAYQGAREDLAIWKRRALEAERRVRKQDQIIDRMSDDLNAISGPTFMGEPVLLKRPVPDVSELVEALEDCLSFIENDAWPKVDGGAEARKARSALAAHRKGAQP